MFVRGVNEVAVEAEGVHPVALPGPQVGRLVIARRLEAQRIELRVQMTAQGFTATGEGPREFADIIRNDLEKWGKVIRNLPSS